MYVLLELLLRPPFGVGILLPTLGAEVLDFDAAGPFPAVETDAQDTETHERRTLSAGSCRPHSGGVMLGEPTLDREDKGRTRGSCGDITSPVSFQEAFVGSSHSLLSLENGVTRSAALGQVEDAFHVSWSTVWEHCMWLILTLLRGCSLVENVCLAQVHCAASRAHQMNLPCLQQRGGTMR